MELTSATDSARTDTYVAPFRGTYSVPAARMRDTLFDVGSARYDIADRQRVYLFDADLGAGVQGGRFLLLPQLDPAATGARLLAIAALDPSKPWQSMRVYDTGMCSSVVPWAGLTSQLAAAVDAAVLGNGYVVRGRRFGPVRFQPRLRTIGDNRISIDELDALELTASYDADEISDLCFNGAHLDIRVEIRLERRPGTIRRAPNTPAAAFLMNYSPSCRVRTSGSTLISDSGDEYDFEAIPTVSFDLRGACIAGARDIAEGIVEAQIAGLVPDLVRQQLFSQLAVPLLRAADHRRCTCDEECNSESVQGVWTTASGTPIPGRRHVCRITNADPSMPDGTCVPILEPDRIFVRPEGIEVVLSESPEDFQDAFYDFDVTGVGTTLRRSFCAATRPPVFQAADTPRVEVLSWPVLVP